MNLTREERIEIFRTQKVLSGKVFYIEVLPKSGMCDLADTIELQLLVLS